MESFTAEIAITGICGIVPKKEYPDPPKAFCVVLPNGWRTTPDSEEMKESKADGFSRIRRHNPFVSFAFQPREPEENRPDLAGLWHLNSHRLLVEPTFIDEASELAAEPAWDQVAGISGLASFADITDDPSLLTVANAVRSPDPAIVAAQVVLHHGTLKSEAGSVYWLFDGFLRSSPSELLQLNHLAVVTLENLASLRIRRVDFAGNSVGEPFVFSHGPAFVTVANLCDQNPLQWGESPAPTSLLDDDDFRLHYEVVDNLPRLQGELEGARCPIPRFTNFGNPGGGGLNCDPIRWPAVFFQF